MGRPTMAFRSEVPVPPAVRPDRRSLLLAAHDHGICGMSEGPGPENPRQRVIAMADRDDPPRYGLYIYPAQGAMSGATAGWSEISDMARTAEQIGFDWVALPDRLDMSGTGLWESVTMMSAIAAVTSRVKLTHAVMRSIYRNPALAAKIVDSLTEISGGRYVWGVGAGSTLGDNARFGYPEDHRYSRFKEAFEITHTLLKDGRADYEGQFYSVKDCVLSPLPARAGVPEVLMAASGPKMMRLAARYADYWSIPVTPLDPAGYTQDVEKLRQACDLEGRDFDSIRKIASVIYAPLPGDSGPAKGYGETLSGSVNEVCDAVSRITETGFSEMVFWPLPNSPAAVEAMAPVISELHKRGA